MHVYRWDLDRTYLDSAIHGVRDLIRSALEDAGAKRSLPGAAPLLRGLIATDPAAHVCFLSGSPEQMRSVIAEKLAADGVRPHRLLLKDNLANLKRGRFAALRRQVGYKLPALLVERASTPSDARESLFGDDSEADAFIYVVYAEVVAGRLSDDALRRLLVAGGAYPDQIAAAVAAAPSARHGDRVDHIFIRLDKRTPTSHFDVLGAGVTLVHHWLQAALVLHRDRRLDPSGTAAMWADARATLGDGGADGLVADAIARGLVTASDATSALSGAWSSQARSAAPAARAARAPTEEELVAWMSGRRRRS